MRSVTLLSILILVCSASAAGAQFTAERVASGFSQPILVTVPDDDPDDLRLFVVEKGGLIRIIDDGVVLGTAFLNVAGLLGAGNERGLLGLAFAPDYSESGLFYINYTNTSGNTVIARYGVSGNPDVADAGSAEILMTINQTASNHNGGHLAFSPADGFLYIGMGDGGGNRNDAQNTSNPLGAMLRIDVSESPGYTIPASNPGFDDDRIWSHGLRNPYRFSFDRATGDLLIGDVGEVRVEEVDFQPASSDGGENYGWPISEGSDCFSPPSGCDMTGLTPPVMEYRHGEVSGVLSVTGGYRYRGPVAALQGVYFFADFGGALFAANATGPGSFSFSEVEIETDQGAIGQVSGFGEDVLGNVYIVDFDGEIFRLASGVPCPETPRSECRSAERSSLQMKAGKPKKQKLAWKWKRGAATSIEDFGDPTLGGTFLMCLYEDSPSELVSQIVVPPGAAWNSSKQSFQYKDKSAAFGGVHKVRLGAGTQGKSRIQLGARGAALTLPELPLNPDGEIVVQLSSSETGACWESRFSTGEIRSNESESFKAKLR